MHDTFLSTIDAPILDKKMVYKWEVTKLKPYYLNHCEGIVKDSKAMVVFIIFIVIFIQFLPIIGALS